MVRLYHICQTLCFDCPKKELCLAMQDIIRHNEPLTLAQLWKLDRLQILLDYHRRLMYGGNTDSTNNSTNKKN